MEGQDVEKEPLPKKPRLHQRCVQEDALTNAEEDHTHVSLTSEPSSSSKHLDSIVSVETAESPGVTKGTSVGLQHSREEDVGITYYISTQPGIFGILKQRYSDFVVHELAMDGSMVQLTDYSLPSDPQPTTSLNLEDVFSAADISRIRSLSENENDNKSVKIPLNSDATKEQRRLMHEAIREHFPMLESGTEEDEETNGRSLIIQRGNKQNKGKRSKWPQKRGDFCQFVLFKENKDTMEAINLISKILKIKSSSFHYAGTKDRRAVTSQLVTAYRVSAEKLITLNDAKKSIRVGNFKYVKEQLRLGSLTGNRFSIILRRVSCDDHVIAKSLVSLKEIGFVNYFGMQRFGTGTIPTHHIGRCLLHSDWEGAINLILKPRPGELQEVREAREYYHSCKDARGALKRMPKWMNMERQLLQGLEKHADKRNFLGALNFIPRNMRLMYVHSWQSYVWNTVVSWRLQTYGVSPIVGDIVWKSNSDGDYNSKSEVEFLSEETKSNFSIHDILLPLPGFDVQFPENDAKEEFMKILSEEGISVDQLQHRVKDFSLSGSYRPVVVKPSDVTWEVLQYNDVTKPLILTDVDIMTNEPQPLSIPGAESKALKLEFNLPSSTYATMALRDVLKMDTSSAYQTTLNEQTI